MEQVEKKRKWPFLLGGVIIGLLVILAVTKVSKPVIRSACKYILEMDGAQQYKGRNRKVSIEASRVEVGEISRRVTTVGKLRANQFVVVKSEIHGRIKELLFEQGADVEEGQIIIQFEDAGLAADVKQAEAELAHRKAAFERIDSLYVKKIESSKNRDEAQAAYQMAEARLESAQVKLDQAAIKAPFSGTIGIIDVSPGAYVQAGADLVKLVDTSEVLVDFKIPEKYVNDIGAGQLAEIKVDGFKEPFRSLVQAVDSQVDHLSHSIAVRSSIQNDEGELKPGVFANVSLVIGRKNDAILIPDSSVDREGEIEFIWAVHKGKATRRRVLTGTRESGKIEIVAGLKQGDIIVTAGQIKLADGTAVTITNMPEFAEPAKGDAKEAAKPATAEAEPDAQAKPAAKATPAKTAPTVTPQPKKAQASEAPTLPPAKTETPQTPAPTAPKAKSAQEGANNEAKSVEEAVSKAAKTAKSETAKATPSN